jgi:hypothetical protein
MDQDALTERECMLSVVDPKGKGENKFRYVVVTQDEMLVCLCDTFPALFCRYLFMADIGVQRDRLRSVVPTPLMYVRRSVMVSIELLNMNLVVEANRLGRFWSPCLHHRHGSGNGKNASSMSSPTTKYFQMGTQLTNSTGFWRVS